MLLSPPPGWFPHVEPLWHVYIATVNRQRGACSVFSSVRTPSMPALSCDRWDRAAHPYVDWQMQGASQSPACGQRLVIHIWSQHHSSKLSLPSLWLPSICDLSRSEGRAHLDKSHNAWSVILCSWAFLFLFFLSGEKSWFLKSIFLSSGGKNDF